MNKGILTSVLAIASLAAGFAVYHYSQEKGAAPETNTAKEVKKPQKVSVLNEKRPEFSLPDLEGVTHHIKEWDGKVILLNFWATWCPPCRKEMPAFVELQNKYGPQGFQVIGVAIDQKSKVNEFAKKIGVNYPLLIGALHATRLSRHYGNSGGQLPYSVFINREGQLVAVKRGELKKELAEKIIRNLMNIKQNASK